jgi:hypothetical protein
LSTALLGCAPRDVWIAPGGSGVFHTVTPPGEPYVPGMNTVTHRHRLARFIDLALTPRTWHGLRLAAVPVPRSVLATCGDAMRDLAAALRDERRTVDAATLRDVQRLLTHGGVSPLYDRSHPIRALHALVAIESRFDQATVRAA